MIKILFINLLIFIIGSTVSSCSKIRESAGVTRKSIDEYQAVENPPLIIPPDYNLVDPDKIDERNIDETDSELAKEILFGLDEKQETDDQDITTMNQILSKANVDEVSEDIRKEIDEEFANEKNTKGVFQIEWDNEIEVLDAVKESERIRNQNFEGDSISDDELYIKKEKINKKKKRFFFF